MSISVTDGNATDILNLFVSITNRHENSMPTRVHNGIVRFDEDLAIGSEIVDLNGSDPDGDTSSFP